MFAAMDYSRRAVTTAPRTSAPWCANAGEGVAVKILKTGTCTWAPGQKGFDNSEIQFFHLLQSLRCMVGPK